MDVIISEAQSAFIPRRIISDNIMVAFEVMHYMKRKKRGNDCWMALKIGHVQSIRSCRMEIFGGNFIKNGVRSKDHPIVHGLLNFSFL